MTFVNVGANKGYHIPEWLGLLTQQPISNTRWHGAIKDFAAEAGGPGGMTERMAAPAKVFATERLTPPPREIYALHRKLSGAISTCTKLGVRIECRGVLQEIWEASELA